MSIKLSKKLKNLPQKPGVYLFKNKQGRIIYVGKAGSLKHRVKSYFQKSHNFRTEALVLEIFDLEVIETPSALEALILEADLIKKHRPKYNVKEKDDKSFIYVGITKEDFSKPILVRGHELEAMRTKLQASFGPYTSASSIRAALKILRKIFPWSECNPNQGRPCFYYGIKQCPGVCMGEVKKPEYNKNIRNLKLFFKGERKRVLKNLEHEMKEASKSQKFEKAGKIRNRIYALEHIRDTSLITKDDQFNYRSPDLRQYGGVMGRIEGYDVSYISGKEATGSMVVFVGGKPKKSEYRKFRIKTIKGANDVGMLKEVLTRRFKNDWPKPDIILIDGGKGQVSVAEEILRRKKLKIPIIGIAKGLKRKNDRFVFDYDDLELKRITKSFPDLLKQVRNEAHRFAVKYHRELRGRGLTKMHKSD